MDALIQSALWKKNALEEGPKQELREQRKDTPVLDQLFHYAAENRCSSSSTCGTREHFLQKWNELNGFERYQLQLILLANLVSTRRKPAPTTGDVSNVFFHGPTNSLKSSYTTGAVATVWSGNTMEPGSGNFPLVKIRDTASPVVGMTSPSRRQESF